MISKHQNMLTLENSLFLVLEVVFENHHATEPCFFFFFLLNLFYSFTITDDYSPRGLIAKGTVAIRLAEPGKEKVHLYFPML